MLCCQAHSEESAQVYSHQHILGPDLRWASGSLADLDSVVSQPGGQKPDVAPLEPGALVRVFQTAQLSGDFDGLVQKFAGQPEYRCVRTGAFARGHIMSLHRRPAIALKA